MRNIHAVRIACALSAMSLLFGCQGATDSGENNASAEPGSASSKDEASDAPLYSKALSAIDVCPAAGELESLPTGVSFKNGELISGGTNSLEETNLDCVYGIYVNYPEYDRIEENFIALDISVNIRDEEIRDSPEYRLTYGPLSYFAEWQNVSWTYHEGETTDICVGGPDEFLTPGLALDTCREGPNTLVYASSVLLTSVGNLQISLQGAYYSAGDPIEDSEEEALGAAMTELTTLVMERIPLVEN